MIKEVIRKLANTDEEVYSIIAKVVNVDNTNRTVDVSPINGDAPIIDVKLQALEKSEDGLVMIPAVGSFVIVTFIDDVKAFVTSTDVLDSILVNIGSQAIRINSEGIAVKSSITDLSDELSTFVDIIKGILSDLEQFKVLCSGPGSPSSAVFPASIGKLKQRSIQLDEMRNKLQTIITNY
jgi:hypothetical protein